MSIDAQRLGAALRRLRKLSGRTQGQVAELAGIDAPTISRYERGKRTFQVEALDLLLAAYGVDLVGWLEIVRPPTPSPDLKEPQLRILREIEWMLLRLAELRKQVAEDAR